MPFAWYIVKALFGAGAVIISGVIANLFKEWIKFQFDRLSAVEKNVVYLMQLDHNNRRMAERRQEKLDDIAADKRKRDRRAQGVELDIYR